MARSSSAFVALAVLPPVLFGACHCEQNTGGKTAGATKKLDRANRMVYLLRIHSGSQIASVDGDTLSGQKAGGVRCQQYGDPN
jgi:hypothetical protein